MPEQLQSRAEWLRVRSSGRGPIWGVDGVVVKSVDNGLIYGEGELDPPGSRRPVVPQLESGDWGGECNRERAKLAKTEIAQDARASLLDFLGILHLPQFWPFSEETGLFQQPLLLS